MNRRGFLKGLGAIIGGVALEQAIPLGRVWSFPKEIKCINALPSLSHLSTVWYDATALEVLKQNLKFHQIIHPYMVYDLLQDNTAVGLMA